MRFVCTCFKSGRISPSVVGMATTGSCEPFVLAGEVAVAEVQERRLSPMRWPLLLRDIEKGIACSGMRCNSQNKLFRKPGSCIMCTKCKSFLMINC